MYLILGILAFNIMVIVHELGHFLAAKMMGIRVLEFSLFVGPKLFSITRGGTTYSVRLFPIMAYVRLEGDEEASDSPTSFNRKPKYARAFTMVAGPLANLLLAAILLTGYFAIRGYQTTEISEIAEGSPAEAAGLQEGDRIVSYGGKRVYSPIDLVQFLYVTKGEPVTVEYKRNGKLMKGELKPIYHPETSSPMMGVVLDLANPEGSNVLKEVNAGSPAEKAGLMAGDKIVAINGTEVDSYEKLSELVKSNGIMEIEVTAMRNGALISTFLTPVEVKTEEWYEVGLDFNYVRGEVLDALGQSAIFTYSIIRSVYYSPKWLVTGRVDVSDMMGPIGMVSTITTTVSQAPNVGQMFLYLMYITGMLNATLGATNLLPFPALDGGRLVLIGLEAVRGKPLSPEKESIITMAGFIIIILLGIYIAYNDFLKFVIG
ncbi:MAG TPA: site-2 protease family protein [Clostridia bacterium]|nr:site-2 protease family protein [Clostridiales bacterium]